MAPRERSSRFSGAPGGDGGGALRIDAAETIVSGTVSANGDDGASFGHPGHPRGGGGGSGGSVLLRAQVVDLADGIVEARGGTGGHGLHEGRSADGGSGGAGRIRIEYSQRLEGTPPAAASTAWIGSQPIQDLTISLDPSRSTDRAAHPADRPYHIPVGATYRSVTVESGAYASGSPWNGSTGGAVRFTAEDVGIEGTLTADGIGYRGGRAASGPGDGYQGESPFGFGARIKARNGGGGGGGVGEDAGGGGGGYGSVGTDGSHPEVGRRGEGGSAYGDAELTTLHLGAGGGSSGSQSRISGGAGGAGGGAIAIEADRIVVRGRLSADGTPGLSDGHSGFPRGGGGGAGGSILLRAIEIDLAGAQVRAKGGIGGYGIHNGNSASGGSGGDGRIRLEPGGTLLGATDPAASVEQVTFISVTGPTEPVIEGTEAVYVITVTNPDTQTVTVQYSTVDGSAVGGTDHSVAAGTLTFAPDGPFVAEVRVPIEADESPEPDETFVLRLSSPVNAFLSPQHADVLTTILNQLPPSPAVFGPVVTPTLAATAVFDLVFSEPVSGLAIADLGFAAAPSGCVIHDPVAAGSVPTASWSVEVSGCLEGTVQLHLSPDSVTDGTGVTGPPAAVVSTPLVVDRTGPLVYAFTLQSTSDVGASDTDGLSSAAVLAYDLSFSEPVAGVDAADIEVTGTATACLVGPPSGSDGTWLVTVANCSEGTVSVSLLGGSVADLAGNPGPADTVPAADVTIDRTAPLLVLAASTAARTSDTGIEFTLAGHVNDVLDCGTLTADDLVVAGGELEAIGPTGDGHCAVSVTSSVLLGTVDATSLAAAAGFSVADAAGNATIAVAGSPASVTVDREAPSLTLTALTANPAHGSALVFALTAQAGELLDCATLAGSDLAISRGSLAGVMRISDTECDIAITSSVIAGARGTTSLTAAAGFSVADSAGNTDTIPDGSPAGVVVDRTFRAGFGDGHDGDVVVTSGQTLFIDAVRAAFAASAAAGQRNVTVTSATGFAVGQHVLIIQMQGTGAGGYELGIIEGISNTTLRLQQPLAFAYTTGGVSRAQVIVVPRYRDLTVRSGGVVTAHAWDGSTGGVVVARASGVLTVESGGRVDGDGKGFRGGDIPNAPIWYSNGFNGESYSGPSSQSRFANGGGGGGGCDYENAGGQGAGHGAAGAAAGGNQCGGAQSGAAYGAPDLGTLHLGSGGGSAGGCCTDGGNGGGAILLLAQAIQVSGTISAKANAGQDDRGSGGGAGGGSGGSIKLVTTTATLPGPVTATGGAGGYGSHLYIGQRAMGGNGAEGRIAIQYCTQLVGTTTPTAVTTAVSCPAPLAATMTLQAGSDTGSSGSDRITAATLLLYDLVFSGPVTDLSASDLVPTGTATGCLVGDPTGAGATWTMSVTGCTDGTLALTLMEDAVDDAYGSAGPSPAVTAAALTIDRTAPTVASFSPTTSSPTSDATITYALTFSEPVAGLAVEDLTIAAGSTATGCTIEAPTGSDADWTITVTGCSDGSIVLRLSADSVTDVAGNTGPAVDSDASEMVIDRTAPVVTAFALQSGSDTGVSEVDLLTSAAELTFDLTLSEPVTGVEPADLSNGGTASGCTWSMGGTAPSATWTVTASGCSAGTLDLAFAADGATDTAAITGPATSAVAPTVTIDRTTPVLTLQAVTTSPTNTGDLEFSLVSSEAVDCSTLDADDLIVTDGILGPIEAIGELGCSIAVASDVASGSAGTTTLAITPAFSVADLAGNAPTTASGSPTVVTVDRQAPTVSTLALQPASDSGTSDADRHTNAGTLTFDLALSEPGTGLDTTDFLVTGSSTATGCDVDGLDGSGATWTVAVSNCSEGTVTLRLGADSVNDPAGNDGPTVAVDAAAVTIDRTDPSATLTAVTESPTNEDTVSYSITFSEPVVGLAITDLETSGTATGCLVDTPIGSGPDYVLDVSGCTGGTVTLTLAADSVVDGAGNLGPAVPMDAAEVTIDRTPPGLELSSVTASPTNATALEFLLAPGPGDTLDCSALDGDDLDVTGGTLEGVSSDAGGGCAIAVTSSVDAGDTGSTSVSITSAFAVADAIGNVATDADGSPASITVDRQVPAVVTFAPTTTSPTNADIVDFDLVFSEPVTGLVAGDLDLSGSATGCSVDVTGSGPTDTWAIAVGDCSDGTVGLSLAADGVVDVAGNTGPADQADAATITIDRTAPVLADITMVPSPVLTTDTVTITADASDPLVVISADLRVDDGDWVALAATDGAYDSDDEGLTGSFGPLSAGEHENLRPRRGRPGQPRPHLCRAGGRAASRQRAAHRHGSLPDTEHRGSWWTRGGRGRGR